MINILVTAPLDFIPDLKDMIRQESNLVYAYQSNLQEIKAVLMENSFDAWLVSPCPKYLVNDDLMSLCPSLKIISTPSTGTNHINIDDAKKGILKYIP